MGKISIANNFQSIAFLLWDCKHSDYVNAQIYCDQYKNYSIYQAKNHQALIIINVCPTI